MGRLGTNKGARAFVCDNHNDFSSLDIFLGFVLPGFISLGVVSIGLKSLGLIFVGLTKR
jgi:hypothetical protein